MGKSCKEVAQSLVDCMKNTPCVKGGGDLRECINNPHKCPNGDVDMNAVSMCQEYRTAYYLCKRSALDMRTRIQGQKAY